MNKKTMALAGAILIGGLLTFNSSAYADKVDASTSASKQKPARFEKFKQEKIGGFRDSAQLKELVTAGTITQATADKIQTYFTEQENVIKAEKEKLQAMTPEQRKAYFESKKTAEIKRVDLFTDMVEKGVITQQQADAIKSKLQALQQAKQQESLKTKLDQLVQSKTITQEQAVKITEYVNKQQALKAAELEKLKAMTKEELDAYFKNQTVKKTDMLSQLVTDKVLTQEQADAVEEALHPRGFSKGEKSGMQRKSINGIPKL